MSLFVVCHVAGSDVAPLCAPAARLRAEGGDVALLRCCCCVGACRARCGRCLAALRRCWCWPLVTVMSEVGSRRGRWWWLRESRVVC